MDRVLSETRPLLNHFMRMEVPTDCQEQAPLFEPYGA
jgi:hypothetical protein